MKLFPFRRPSLGLSIDSGSLVLAEVRRGWRRPSLRRCAARPLPAGLLKISASEPNVTDVAGVSKEVSALLADQQLSSRPLPVALSLPDLCGRVALLEFDSLPQKSEEADDLVRWQFQKDTHMPAEGLRFTSQTFQQPSMKGSGPGRIRVLAAGIREQVVEPYERACELAGLLPVSVGLAGLQLFDLCRPLMQTALKTSGECFYLFAAPSCMAFIAIRAGDPAFIRIKSLRNGIANGSATPHGAGVEDELLATMQFYMEHRADQGQPPPVSRTLFVVNGGDTIPVLMDAMGITVVPVGWEDVQFEPPPSGVLSCAGLTALAAVMEN